MLTRRSATKDVATRIVVFCEGEKSEPTYLQEFIREHGSALINLEIIPAGGVPKTLVDSARDRIKVWKRDKSNYRSEDTVWVMFDCDDHPRLKNALEEARNHGISVAYSAPCFELWAILHRRDFDAAIDHRALQAECEKCVDGYDRKRGKVISYERLRDGYDLACKRAATLRERRKNDGALRPYTNVDELMHKIKSTANPDG